MPARERRPRSPARKKTSEQSQGNLEQIAAAARAGERAADDNADVRVANPRPSRRGATAGAGGTEAAGAPLRGETEVEFRGWPAAWQNGAAAEPAAGRRLLDVWHATYSSAVTIDALQKDSSLAEAVMETILPSGDDREPITATLDFPWRCICMLLITAQDGSQWVGSGWLAGNRTVVTAGHCVYIHGRGGWVRQIAVYPGRNGDTIPYTFTSTELRSVKGWTDGQSPQSDYGAILLPQPAVVGFFGYQSMTDDELNGLLVNVYGYPADKPAGTLWGHYRQLQQVLPGTLVYNISTYGGQSGCPVFYKNGEDRSVVGIHNYGDVTGNSATRITDAVFDNIEAWKAEAT